MLFWVLIKTTNPHYSSSYQTAVVKSHKYSVIMLELQLSEICQREILHAGKSWRSCLFSLFVFSLLCVDDAPLELCAPVCLCEPCVNMLIQAVPVTHSCPAWLRSGVLIILAGLTSVGPAACRMEKRRYHCSTFVTQLRRPCHGPTHDERVCCNVLVSR